MNPRFIFYDVYANLKQWFRNRSSVFWSLLFPILLILLYGSIFSGSNDITYTIAIQDLDDSTYSHLLIDILENISIIDIKNVDKNENITSYMLDNDLPAAIVIPNGFGEDLNDIILNPISTTNLSFYYDPARGDTVDVIKTVLQSTLYEINMQLTGGRKIIGLNEKIAAGENLSYIDFFLPGMIGFTIMTSSIYGSIERNTKYRKNGILRKLLTTPVNKTEWLLAKMLFMLFLSFLSTIIILIVGWIVFNLHVHLDIFTVILVISTSFLFSGIGMIISRFVKEEETADMAGGAITFPMMFLAGTFFPLEIMPEFLQMFAKILPLYYVNEGFRNAMIYMDIDKTLY
ncbi:MAG TPA: ABC transporter permease, partial [Thermoplasmatales archaeon]|nr:ABC transporter permease [Thermoplasmatales archaeon]